VGLPYPQGPWRPPESVQRGSVQFNSLCAGDPARLDSNQSTLELCGFAPEDIIPKIPVLPISYADALPLLRQLSNPPGAAPPPDFQGALPLQYQTGPGPAIVTLDVENDIRPGVIHNIYATIPGTAHGTARDQEVLLGNHRDAWVFGAVDPNSGTAALLEVARALGTLLRQGWRPRRTIVLCSWDGEEYGLLGSTAWAERRAQDLSSRAVAYLNVDVGVSGRDLSVHVSALLQARPACLIACRQLTVPAYRCSSLLLVIYRYLSLLVAARRPRRHRCARRPRLRQAPLPGVA
jgi:N-acetylated-alpha-linked acidic dipeptidase